ncbi:uncharacterized protein B0T23DRAFT_391820 [Neurospora hispaniola]|uniref:GAR domain-containing protein n=1 Tax=Neurospora hispaniola TaxID=588809 RepID=A0AAJ0IG14_9PEZI|nr:hypothetical protein B0T23DRAFT_391820 [Neurospora hispaniola]
MTRSPSSSPNLSHALAVVTPRSRPPRSSTESPPRHYRENDDLLSNLTPRTALDTIRNPTGEFRACMASASPTEQAFALRAAIASNKIQEWLDELSSWPWPSGASSAGFQVPDLKRRKFESASQLANKLYCGSLPAAEVAKYEKRVDEIYKDMEEIDIEEIKNHVLRNHIVPLSAFGSPILGSSRPLPSYSHMDDLTAFLTATIMQTLPNLARLSRLLNSWSIRLLVLKRVPAFLDTLADGEIALQSGRNVAGLDSNARAIPSRPPSPLSWAEFNVIKSVLEKKVAKAGRDLDVMLDSLEGWEYTLPDEWLDRVESLEKQYGEWVAACEHKIKQADLKIDAPTNSDTAAKLDLDERKQQQTNNAPTNGAVALTVQDQQSDDLTDNNKTINVDVPPLIKVHVPLEGIDENDAEKGENDSWTFVDETATPETNDESLVTDERPLGGFDGSDIEGAPASGMMPSPNIVACTKGSRPHSSSLSYATSDGEYFELDPFDSDFDFDDSLEHDLPGFPRSRRDSNFSTTSTIVFGNRVLEQETPDRSRRRSKDLDGSLSRDVSPPSSPPRFSRSKSRLRSLSRGFSDMPTVAELPDFDESNFESSAINEDGNPSKSNAGNSDEKLDLLQQQISEILESVPAKIRLTSEPSPINLNPPDFTALNRKSSKPELRNRSQSSLSTRSTLSSRAGTPSFTLAPAPSRSSRQRNRGSHRDIKIYHLTRNNGEAPIKLFIRCVGENGERVMVRIGGGWADLGEYLRVFASHHRRNVALEGKVEVNMPRVIAGGSSSPTRPPSTRSTQDRQSPPDTPLNVRKTRKPAEANEENAGTPKATPKTPFISAGKATAVSSPRAPSVAARSRSISTRSRSSSRLSHRGDEEIVLGLAGPRTKNIEMSEEDKAWVEDMKAKVQNASGMNRQVSDSPATAEGKFGDMGKIGGTKRVFKRQGGLP